MTRRSRPRLLSTLHYAFDTTMAMGWLAQAGLVLGAYAVLVAVTCAVLLIASISPAGQPPFSPPESAWVSLVHALNSGPVSRADGWPFRLVMLVTTLGGMFTTVTLTGIVTSAIGRKLQDLRRGRSHVLEAGHTLILGWTPAIFPILDELVKANAHRRRHRVVILAERDQLEMEDALRRHDGAEGRTRVICRTGSPIRSDDLAIVSPADAKAIVVLAPVDPRVGDPDAHVIRTLLALAEAPARRAAPYHVVAEIRDPARLAVAAQIGGSGVELVAPAHVIPHLIVQTCLQPGLSSVYRALFRYEGSEIYFRDEPAAVGRPFGEVLGFYENAAVMGLAQGDGGFTLAPPGDRLVRAGDRLIALAETNEAFQRRRAGVAPRPATVGQPAVPPAEPQILRRVLLLGWNAYGPAIVRELDHYVQPGSALTVVAPTDGPRASLDALDALAPGQLTLVRHRGDPHDPATWEALDLPAYDHVILLAPGGTMPPEEADARTLVALVQIRAMLEARGARVSITSEIHEDLPAGPQRLARADDFVVGDLLISTMLAQIAENKALNAIFADLLNAQGAELVLRPATDYVLAGAAVRFEEVVAAVARRGEVALGYRATAAKGATGGAFAAGGTQGVVLNPAKSTAIALDPGDQLIVLTPGKPGAP